MKKTTEDKEVMHAKLACQIAGDYAPCSHLFVWAMVSQRYPGIHPAEVYRSLRADPGLSFDGKTSIVSVSKTTKKGA